MTEPIFWTLSADALFRSVESAPSGLSSDAATARLQYDGPNNLGTKPRRRIIADVARRLANPLVLILLVASAVAGLTGDLVSFVIIAVVVLLSTLLDMMQEHRAAVTADALRQSIALRAEVLRDGAFVDLPVEAIVAGDVVALSAGDLVPADGILLTANAVQVNEALLTGEPYPVEKSVQAMESVASADNTAGALFHGTSVIAGSLQMLVIATGKRTRLGAIAGALNQVPPPTAFEHGIHRLGMLIVRMTIFLVLFVLLTHLALGRAPLQSFLFAMALAVGLTPELLPMIMTVALSRGAQRMAAARVVVKRLSSIHDLGQMDILCTDKTGTLTEAKITLVGHPGIDGTDSERVLELAAVNARFESGLKSPLDEALLDHTAEHDLDEWSKLDEHPFDFERRRVSVLAERDGSRVEIVKGAPETLLALCSAVEARDGKVLTLDDGLRDQLKRLHDERAGEGLRLLAVAWKAAPGRERIGHDDDNGLIFAGYCVFVDPPKPSATSAVARLGAAGVRIKVISGDAAPVVGHLVRTLQLPVSGILTGTEIASLSDQALAARVEEVDVFARVTPDQKTRIVRALRARGHTVGFIGDGINDAPAIRAADVGLSVDGATDVARDAADMILLAPDLGVLADGVCEGRRTYANIMKYLRMGTSSNFGNMLSMAIASLWLPFLPLTPVQVLLNNLIYDLSQIGIPFDGAGSEDLAKPHAWDMAGIMRFTAIMGPLSTIFDVATFALLIGVAHAGIGEFRAAWFIESMASQILVVFVIRTSLPFWRSRPNRALVASALLGMLGALALPFGPWAGLLGFTSPGPAIVAGIGALIMLYLAAAEALKGYALRPSAAKPSRPAFRR